MNQSGNKSFLLVLLDADRTSTFTVSHRHHQLQLLQSETVQLGVHRSSTPTTDWSGQLKGAGLWSEPAAAGGARESADSSMPRSGVTGQMWCVGTFFNCRNLKTWNLKEPERFWFLLFISRVFHRLQESAALEDVQQIKFFFVRIWWVLNICCHFFMVKQQHGDG